MQHVLLNISKDINDSNTQIDILSHFNNENNSEWYNMTYKDSRVQIYTYIFQVNVDPTTTIGISNNGKVIIIIKHQLPIHEELSCREEPILEDSIHLQFLSTDMSIEEYIESIMSIKNKHVIVSDGKKVFQLETTENEFYKTSLESGLYLYAYNNEDV